MKFPSYIINNPAIEPPKTTTTAALDLEYRNLQKKDHEAGIQYAEEHILSKPIQNWIAESFVEDLKTLGEILGKTVATHPCSVAFGASQKEGYRTSDSITTKQIPDPAFNATFNLDCPDDIASMLIWKDCQDWAADESGALFDPTASAAHFVKWFLKMHRFEKKKVLADLDGKMEKMFEKHDFESFGSESPYQEWRRVHFDGKSLKEWRDDFFKAHANQAYSLENEQPPIKPLAARQMLPGLLTREEVVASQRVVKIFPLSDEIPKRMYEMAIQVIRMVQERKDPIQIATYFHIQFTNIHPLPNGNGRTARDMMNIILMNFGYPAIDVEGDLKNTYYRAVEAADEDPKIFETFIRNQIESHLKKMSTDPRTQPIDKMATALCKAASTGDVDNMPKYFGRTGRVIHIAPLIAMGNTALHYACQQGRWPAASLLIQQGARLDRSNHAGKDPLQLIKDNPEKVAELKVLFGEVQAKNKDKSQGIDTKAVKTKFTDQASLQDESITVVFVGPKALAGGILVTASMPAEEEEKEKSKTTVPSEPSTASQPSSDKKIKMKNTSQG